MGFSFGDVELFKQQFEKIDNIYNATQLILGKIIQMEGGMATLRESLTSLGDLLTGLETDVQRVLDAVGNPDVTLNAEAQAAVDALAARMGTLDSAMDTAVPETPPTP